MTTTHAPGRTGRVGATRPSPARRTAPAVPRQAARFWLLALVLGVTMLGTTLPTPLYVIYQGRCSAFLRGHGDGDVRRLRRDRAHHLAAGGIFHTLPFLIPGFGAAIIAAIAVVATELLTLAWLRHKFFQTSFARSFLAVTVGGTIIASLSAALGILAAG